MGLETFLIINMTTITVHCTRLLSVEHEETRCAPQPKGNEQERGHLFL